MIPLKPNITNWIIANTEFNCKRPNYNCEESNVKLSANDEIRSNWSRIVSHPADLVFRRQSFYCQDVNALDSVDGEQRDGRLHYSAVFTIGVSIRNQRQIGNLFIARRNFFRFRVVVGRTMLMMMVWLRWAHGVIDCWRPRITSNCILVAALHRPRPAPLLTSINTIKHHSIIIFSPPHLFVVLSLPFSLEAINNN